MNIIEKTTEFSRDFELATTEDRQEILQKTIYFLHEEVIETSDAIDDNAKLSGERSESA